MILVLKARPSSPSTPPLVFFRVSRTDKHLARQMLCMPSTDPTKFDLITVRSQTNQWTKRRRADRDNHRACVQEFVKTVISAADVLGFYYVLGNRTRGNLKAPISVALGAPTAPVGTTHRLHPPVAPHWLHPPPPKWWCCCV